MRPVERLLLGMADPCCPQSPLPGIETKITVFIKTHKDVEKQVQQVRLSAERSVQGLRMLLANEPEALQILRFIVTTQPLFDI